MAQKQKVTIGLIVIGILLVAGVVAYLWSAGLLGISASTEGSSLMVTPTVQKVGTWQSFEFEASYEGANFNSFDAAIGNTSLIQWRGQKLTDSENDGNAVFHIWHPRTARFSAGSRDAAGESEITIFARDKDGNVLDQETVKIFITTDDVPRTEGGNGKLSVTPQMERVKLGEPIEFDVSYSGSEDDARLSGNIVNTEILNWYGDGGSASLKQAESWQNGVFIARALSAEGATAVTFRASKDWSTTEEDMYDEVTVYIEVEGTAANEYNNPLDGESEPKLMVTPTEQTVGLYEGFEFEASYWGSDFGRFSATFNDTDVIQWIDQEMPSCGGNGNAVFYKWHPQTAKLFAASRCQAGESEIVIHVHNKNDEIIAEETVKIIVENTSFERPEGGNEQMSISPRSQQVKLGQPVEFSMSYGGDEDSARISGVIEDEDILRWFGNNVSGEAKGTATLSANSVWQDALFIARAMWDEGTTGLFFRTSKDWSTASSDFYDGIEAYVTVKGSALSDYGIETNEGCTSSETEFTYTPNAWNLKSMPQTSATSISKLVGIDAASLSTWAYQGLGKSYKKTDEFKSGEGMWFNSGVASPLCVTTSDINTNKIGEITLPYATLNLLSNPYPTPLKLSDIQIKVGDGSYRTLPDSFTALDDVDGKQMVVSKMLATWDPAGAYNLYDIYINKEFYSDYEDSVGNEYQVHNVTELPSEIPAWGSMWLSTRQGEEVKIKY